MERKCYELITIPSSSRRAPIAFRKLCIQKLTSWLRSRFRKEFILSSRSSTGIHRARWRTLATFPISYGFTKSALTKIKLKISFVHNK